MPSMPRMMSFCSPSQCALPRWHEGNRAADVNANKQASSHAIFLRCLLLYDDNRLNSASSKMLAGSRFSRQTVSRPAQRSA